MAFFSSHDVLYCCATVRELASQFCFTRSPCIVQHHVASECHLSPRFCADDVLYCRAIVGDFVSDVAELDAFNADYEDGVSTTVTCPCAFCTPQLRFVSFLRLFGLNSLFILGTCLRGWCVQCRF